MPEYDENGNLVGSGYMWDPINGVIPEDPEEFYGGIIDPAYVETPLPAKFNGSHEAARRYMEGYQWGQKNVAEPRDKVAPYVGKAMAATFMAPYMIELLASAPGGAYNAYSWMQNPANQMLVGKLGSGYLSWEALNRIPLVWGNKTFDRLGGEALRDLYWHNVPGKYYNDETADFIEEAGTLASGLALGAPAGILEDVAHRSFSRVPEAAKRIYGNAKNAVQEYIDVIRGKNVKNAEATAEQADEAVRKAMRDLDEAASQFEQTRHDRWNAENDLTSYKRNTPVPGLEDIEDKSLLENANVKLSDTKFGRDIIEEIKKFNSKHNNVFGDTKIDDFSYDELDRYLDELLLLNKKDGPARDFLKGIGRKLSLPGHKFFNYSKEIGVKAPFSYISDGDNNYITFTNPITGKTVATKIDNFGKESKIENISLSDIFDFDRDLNLKNIDDGNISLSFNTVNTGSIIDFDFFGGNNKILSSTSDEFKGAVKEYFDEIRSKIGNSGVAAGSGVLVECGEIAHSPGDIDFVTTKSRLEELKKKLGGTKNRDLLGANGENISSDLLLGGSADISLIDETADGFAIGTEALEFYSVIDPKGFNKLMKESIKKGINLEEMALPIKADDMLDALISNPELMRLKTRVDAFGSYKDKHFPRAINMLFTLDKAEFNKTMDIMVGRYLPDFKKATNLYKNLKFDNVNENIEYLKSIGFDFPGADKFARDPELMEKIVEFQHIQKSISTRSVNPRRLKTGATVDDAVLSNASYSSGIGSAGGGNTMALSGVGGSKGDYGYTTGIIESTQTFNPDEIKTPLDLQKMYLRQTYDDDIVTDAGKLMGEYAPQFYRYENSDITYEDLSRSAEDLAKKYDLPVLRRPLDENSGLGTGGAYVGRYVRQPEAYAAAQSEKYKFETGGADRLLIKSPETGKHIVLSRISSKEHLESKISNYFGRDISISDKTYQNFKSFNDAIKKIFDDFDRSISHFHSVSDLESAVDSMYDGFKQQIDSGVLNDQTILSDINSLKHRIKELFSISEKERKVINRYNPEDFYVDGSLADIRAKRKEVFDKIDELENKLNELTAKEDALRKLRTDRDYLLDNARREYYSADWKVSEEKGRSKKYRKDAATALGSITVLSSMLYAFKEVLNRIESNYPETTEYEKRFHQNYSNLVEGLRSAKTDEEKEMIQEQIRELQKQMGFSYGGLISRLQNHYKDGGDILKAIQSAKDKRFDKWYKTVPKDRNDTTTYNLRLAYDLSDPAELEAWRTATVEELENGEKHLRTVYEDPKTGIYQFAKRKDHPTIQEELDWFNSDDPEAVEFRSKYYLDDSGDYYRYVPKTMARGGRIKLNPNGTLLRSFDPGGPKGEGINNFVSNVLRRRFDAIAQPIIDELGLDEVRMRLYNNIDPFGYHDIEDRLRSAIIENEQTIESTNYDNTRDDIFAEYLQIPAEYRHNRSFYFGDPEYSKTFGNYTVIDSPYYPSKSQSKTGYKRFTQLSERELEDLIKVGLAIPIGKNSVSKVLNRELGSHTVGHGTDDRGEYISYYDKWDLAPFSYYGEDESFGIGVPVEFYDRIYLDDYYGRNTNQENENAETLEPAIVSSKFKDRLDKEDRMTEKALQYRYGGNIRQKKKFAGGGFIVDEDDPAFVGPVRPVVETQDPNAWLKLQDEDMVDRQRYVESKYNDSAYNSATKMTGAYQISKGVADEYLSRHNGEKIDLNNYDDNLKVRDWYINERLPQFEFFRLGSPSDSVRLARTYGAYNWGPGKMRSALNKALEAGVDIDNSWDWLEYLPEETRNYINFIVRGIDAPGKSRSKKIYHRSLKLAKGMSNGGSMDSSRQLSDQQRQSYLDAIEKIKSMRR